MLRIRLAALCLVPVLAGCSLTQRLNALREVEFSLDRVEAVHVAGIDLSRLRSLDDVTPAQAAIIAAGAAVGSVPVDLDLIVRARNPSYNSTTAELFALDWTLLIAEHETVSGRTDRRIQIAPGELVDVPVKAHLDLARFFGRDGRELLSVLRSAVGEHGMPISIALRAVPKIGTPFGPMRYSGPITIARRVGGSEW